jgi:hypothetical protein
MRKNRQLIYIVKNFETSEFHLPLSKEKKKAAQLSERKGVNLMP